jgi:transglutaminase-like putative cysteine protease
MKKIMVMFLASIFLAGCGGAPEVTEPVTQPTEQTVETLPAPVVEAEVAALVEEVPPPTGVVLEPEAPGEQEDRCDAAVVDYSNAEDGYIMVSHFGQTEKRLKVLLKGPRTTYNYDLPQGSWVVLPLSDGDGTYQAGVYRNVQGTEYAMVMLSEFQVTLRDEFAPFLRPNQYVNYLTAPNTVAMGAQLCDGLETSLEKVAAVYDYVVQNVSYDDEKAASVQSCYLPDLDEILEIKKGICFDYASMMTAMLRSQQVPCKLVVGYAGNIYHAWISIWTEENGWVDGAIFFDGHAWKRMDPTFVSSAEDRQEILNFVENGNYRVKYLY